MAQSNCDMCSYYVYDEDDDCYICLVDMDEDDYMRYIVSSERECPFCKLDDEYAIVRKQN